MAASRAWPFSQTLLAESRDVRSHAERKAGCRLWVEVPEESTLAGRRGEVGQVDRSRCLSDAALHVVDGNGLHRTRSFGSRPLERTPAGRPRVSRAELCQLLDDLFAKARAALTALLGQPPAGRAGRSAGLPAAHSARPHSKQSPFLDVRVVEVAECALQLLQCTENAGEVRSVVEGRRDVDQVAEFFGVDPDLREDAPRWCARRWRRPRGRSAGSAASAPRDDRGEWSGRVSSL